MLARLQSFGQKLREAGVPVSNHEMLVAAEALGHLDWSDRESFKWGLAASMCRAPGHLEVFSTLFDLFFAPEGIDLDVDVSPDDITEIDDEELLEAVIRALREGREGELRRLARAVLDRLQSEASGGFLLYRALRFLDLDRLLQRLAEREGVEDWEQAIWRMEVQSRLERLRRILEQEVRRRMVAERGAEDVADRILRVPLEERDFATITSDEVAEVRRAVVSLARRMATRLAKLRKRGVRGRLDMRKTFRKSLSTGGSMVDPQFKVRSRSRPDLVLICDVSGSVAAFTRFTLLLVASLQVQFPRIRSFLFIDTVDEVTETLKASDPADAIPKALQVANVIWLDGHSDYGHSFKQFHENYLEAVNDRSHVIVLGDARSNYRNPEAWVLKDVRDQAKRVWWLNPESPQHWDTGDSVMSAYAEHCDAVHECRNLRQLATFIERLA
ncbi:MAG: vWA domain-containing protein [Actinomycetota bacterium]